MDLKQLIRRAPDRTITAEPDPGGINERRAGTTDMVPGQEKTPISEGSKDALIPPPSGYIPDDNPDPLRRRAFRHPRRGLLASLFGPKEMTSEEKAAQEEQIRRRAMEKLLRDEAHIFMDRIINALNRRELCYRYKKSERDLLVSGVQSVKFSHVVMQPDALYFRVNTQRLPRGVGILQLVDPDILTDLSLACGHKVAAEYREDIGCWYIVERATGVRGIPTHVKFQDMVSAFPQSADEMTIPLGMSTNSRKIYRSLKDMPHLLVAGATDSGKSNMVNVIIGTLILRNSPDHLNLLLVDLKGGMEFTFFEGLPHLVKIPNLTDTGIIYDREKVPEALDWLIWEGERRMAIIKEAGHKNIAHYNAHRKHKLPRIVLVIDEWADVRLVRSVGTEAEDRLSNLASRMRAVGIHVIVATQSPKREVISTIIKTNLPAKMAFSCPTYTASELILDNGDAKGLVPQGRFIYQKGEQLTIQAPYMPEDLIREIVGAAMRGETKYEIKTTHDVTELEVLEYALDHLSGELSWRKLFEHFRQRGLTQKELLAWLQRWEGQTFTVRENEYIVEPNQPGGKPRRLVTRKAPEAEIAGETFSNFGETINEKQDDSINGYTNAPTSPTVTGLPKSGIVRKSNGRKP